MPLGFERLNERTQRPNKNVNFIKPLEGPDKDAAFDYLSRLAAIAVPVMRDNYLYVMSLEEFEPNREFWGRNFNFGEVIQLVLKSPATGRWLPFRFVQMVFMHELAHCKEMNHGRYFWRVRNTYSEQLRGLWSQNYTGDGLWGRGQSLHDGKYKDESLSVRDVQAVQSLCGGTYRRSRRKRKLKTQLSYAERKQRRIKKKFGTNGTPLGDDELQRMGLENGSIGKGKPRVAGSKRGRELRAAALLDRIERSKTEITKQVEEESEIEGVESDVDADDEAVDAQGHRIIDTDGHSFVKVCDEEDANSDANARNEMKELGLFNPPEANKGAIGNDKTTRNSIENHSTKGIKTEAQEADVLKAKEFDNSLGDLSASSIPAFTTQEDRPKGSSNEDFPRLSSCTICSLANEANALTCAACGHVLDVDQLPNHWRCSSKVCLGSSYVNAGDNGVCGICGSPKDISEE